MTRQPRIGLASVSPPRKRGSRLCRPSGLDSRFRGNDRASVSMLAGLLACLLAAAACTAPALDVPFSQGAADTPTPPPFLPTAPPAPKLLLVSLPKQPHTLPPYDSP